ncbi:MAG TPA: hemolysin family protein [Kineobactrum sp.]
MTLLIFFAVLAIAVSFVCSILEAALLSLTPSYIAQLKLSNLKLHDRLAALKNKIDQPLAAILTLNTVAHTVGATGVGAQVTVVFGNGYLGITSAVMTILILVFSEIIPKTIGARYWHGLAPILPACLGAMIIALKPFIWMSDQIMKLFGGQPPAHDIRQEIKALSILGREIDSLDEDEQRVIANILDLHEIPVRDIMTPRIVCGFVNPESSVSEFAEQVKKSQFSRYPVIDSSEAPLGILFRYDLINAEPDQAVTAIMKPVTVVSDKINVEAVMSRFMKERQHMFLVYDEYGTWQGVVTMEDVFETIIGKPIMDETDDIPSMRRHAKLRWKHRLKNLDSDNSLPS